MDKEKRMFPFKYKLGLMLFVIVLFISSFLGISQYVVMRKSLEDGYEQSQKLINDRVLNMVKNADYVNLLVEKPIEKEAEKILRAVSYQYDQEKSLGFDLQPFIKGKENFNIYIIDTTDTVIKSSNNKDIGLNFSAHPDFLTYLNSIRSSNSFVASRISLSIVESNLIFLLQMVNIYSKQAR